MKIGRQFAKRCAQQLLRWNVMRVGERAYAAVPSSCAHEAWFSLEIQRRLLMQRAGVDLVVDVGANVGQFGQSIRRTYAGDLLSFEPASAPFEDLRQTASKESRWRAVQCALGAEDSQLDLQIPTLSVLSSFLTPSEFSEATFGRRARPTAHESVRVRRFDDALSEMVPDVSSRRLFVKLDTQGYDLHVFSGMTRLLDAVVCLQAEVSLRPLYVGMPTWLECLDIYQKAGFHVAGMFPAVCDQLGLPIEYDCLLFRAPDPQT